MVNRKIFTYLKNEKLLIVIVTKKFKISEFLNGTSCKISSRHEDQQMFAGNSVQESIE